MSIDRCCRVAVVVSMLCAAPAVCATEPWADGKLSTHDGLELWLDANREVAAREATGLPKLKSGDSLAEWHDASGAKRHVRQADSKKRPKRVQIGAAEAATSSTGAGWAVRFDGEDDHLRVMDVNQKWTDFTLFMVAAPHSNLGDFRGLFTFNQRDRRDYETGFTLDLNAPGSASLSNLNLEGRGFGGARNLMQESVPFGTLHVIECVADSKAKQVRLAFDGKPAGARPFSPSELIADDITLGARFYTNGPGAQEVRGFFHGDIAEVLLFSRVLTDDETKSVRTYLDTKHAALKEALPKELKLGGAAADHEPLVTVKDAPPIQMLVPGFSVYELPVELTNINNVRYRADGELYALGYNGNIWLLSDTNGDGFEDKADLFFSNPKQADGVPFLRGPIGMAVIPMDHPVLNRDVKGPAPWEKGIKPQDEENPVFEERGGGQSEADVEQKAPLTLTLSPQSRGEGTEPTNSKGIRPEGIIVASKGKVSAIIDHDGDGKADETKIIASGWKEIAQNVDAVGVAIGFLGEIYFGLGTAAYNNAYLIDDAGKAHYDIEGQNGTIQRIFPDLSRRETVCTGIRFPIGLATNMTVVSDDGYESLFASDQEGATWLPNGNPFDELLHIQPGKHYGFPPRHPKHLPGVTDEPSLFDYGPQHQSTCGMAFNQLRDFSMSWEKKVVHYPTFGPEEWEGDLFVTGESRGKLYRTQVRDHQGQYIARNHLIACLNMLTVDCCLSPKGDLVVACHSGGPDWGTGPTGKGKLFVIRHTETMVPQPIATWVAGPQEVRIAFDRPLDPVHLKNLTSQTKIIYGEFVAAGDRFETLRPGYAVVQRQVAAPRFNLPVHGVSVTPDRRALVITTAPHRAAVQYAITLPGLGRVDGRELRVDGQKSNKTTAEPRDSMKPDKTPSSPADHQPSTINHQPLPQHPQIDLAYSLNGVLATWVPEDKTQPGWTGVLTHLDFNVNELFSVEDAHEERFRECLNQKGTLTLETQLDLRNLLHPAVQPGSKLDHEWPVEKIAFTLSGHGTNKSPLRLFVNDKLTEGEESVDHEDFKLVTRISSWIPFELGSDAEKPVRFKIVVGTGTNLIDDNMLPVDGLEWSCGEIQSARFPLNRFFVPWSSFDEKVKDTPSRDIPELAGGSWGRGRRVFFSDEAGCAKCHVAHGLGGAIGPDLSNLIHRDHASVLRDITLPSFALNPDFLPSIVALNDGRVLTGLMRSSTEVERLGLKIDRSNSSPLTAEHVVIGDKDGRLHVVVRSEIDEINHSPISVMPEGLPKKLGEERMRDLLTFLLTEPPHMPRDAKLPAPKPRSRAEVAKVLAGSRVTSVESRVPEKTKKPPSGSRHSTLDTRPLRLLLVAGAKDHGPGEHDYPAWLKAWSELLRGADGVTVDTAMEWPSPEQLAAADTIAFFQKGAWNDQRAKAIDAHLAKGGGLVYIHWAVEGDAAAPAFAQRIGLASHAAKLKYRHGPLDLSFESLGVETGNKHPIGRHFDTVHFHDESYWQMQGDPSRINLIATGIEDGEPRPLFWTLEPAVPNAKEQGRVFVSILGHYSWTFDDPLFRILLLRGIAWSAKEDVDRFNELATIGVKLAE